MTPSSTPLSKNALDVYAKAALGKKASRLVMLDVHGLSSITDVFLVCSGQSNRQVTAIAEHIKADLKKHGIRPLSVEGLTEGHWVVMDYGDVIIHVFYEPIRTFYDIEGLWADAKRITTPSMLAMPAPHVEMEHPDETY
jgi:ribosome-associated protein